MEEEVDTSKPFQGVVVCCTSIPPDQRTEIAQRTSDMGGTHKYDLTPDVTHLIVGDYDTPKYRHVAKERPDIVPMAAGWVEDARNLWMADQAFDFAALEAKWKLKTFESGGGIPNSADPAERELRRLLCCLTGFEDHDMRAMIEEKVKAAGGEYVGDLSKSVTHLITHKPEGKKYLAALRWDIRTVSIEWLNDSIERGMILNEKCYDPTLPKEERGVGAWTRKEARRDTTGKRLRDEATSAPAQGKRKLRKTASMKFNSQNQNLWGSILNPDSPANLSMSVSEDQLADVSSFSLNQSLNQSLNRSLNRSLNQSTNSRLGDEVQSAIPHHEPSEGGIFASCLFFVQGFDERRMVMVGDYLVSNGGRICSSIDDVASPTHPEPSTQRFMVVRQTTRPESLPTLPEDVHLVTEFWIERCVHGKQLFDPRDHVLGRPFPHFPIDGFSDLTICTTGFANERLNQIEKTVVQLGARYAEKFNAQASVLVAPVPVGKAKLDFALHHGIPVVDAEWLWRCIATGFLVPWDEHLLQQPDPKAATAWARRSSGAIEQQPERRKLHKTASEPMLRKPNVGTTKSSLAKTWFDRSGFQDDGPAAPSAAEENPPPQPEAAESHYVTAPTQPPDEPLQNAAAGPGNDGTTVLGEASTNALNKSPRSLRKATTAPPVPAPGPPKERRQFKRFPTGGTIADSDTGDNSPTEMPEEGDEEAGMEAAIKAAAATKKRQSDQEREKQEHAARERQEMSRRLNSLVGPHDSSDTAEDTAKDGAEVTTRGATTAAAPQRRKREIFGRAVSNVSAASSNASAESAAAAAGPHAGAATTAAATPSGNSNTGSGKPPVDGSFASFASGSGREQLFDSMLDTEERQQQQQEKPPPATQLEYDNPEARHHRAAVMDRILRKRGSVGGGGRAAPPPQPSQEKLTMADLDPNSAGAGVVGKRRTTRRQKGF